MQSILFVVHETYGTVYVNKDVCRMNEWMFEKVLPSIWVNFTFPATELALVSIPDVDLRYPFRSLLRLLLPVLLMGCCWSDGNSSFSFLSQNLDWWLTVIARSLPSRVDLPINLPVELSPIYDTNFPINIKIFISVSLGNTCGTAWQYIEYGILPKDINVLVKLNHMFVEYKFNFIYFVVINLHTETIYSQGKFDFDWVMRASSGSFHLHRPIGHFLVEHNV